VLIAFLQVLNIVFNSQQLLLNPTALFSNLLNLLKQLLKRLHQSLSSFCSNLDFINFFLHVCFQLIQLVVKLFKSLVQLRYFQLSPSEFLLCLHSHEDLLVLTHFAHNIINHSLILLSHLFYLSY
jgi:hypothetical protein